MAETAKISLELDLARVQAELRRIPDLTAKEAREMSKAITKEVNRAARATEDAAKQAARAQSASAREAAAAHRKASREIERSYNDQFTAIKGLSGAAVGGIAGDFFDLGEVIMGVSGPLAAIGVGLAALSIAPELIRGVFEFAGGIDETAEALGRVLTGEDKQRAEEYAAATARITDEFNELKLELQILTAIGLTPAVREATRFIDAIGRIAGSDVVAYFGDLSDAVGESKQEFIEASGPLGMFITRIERAPLLIFDVFVALADLTSGVKDAEAAFAPMNAELLKTATVAEKVGRVYYDAGVSVEDAFTRSTKAASDFGKSLEAEAIEDMRAGAHQANELQIAIDNAAASMATMGDTVTDSLNFDELREYNALLAEGSHNIATMGNPEGDGLPKIPEWARDAAAAFGTLASATGQVLGGLEQLARQEQQRHEERVRNLKSERSDNRRTLKDATRDFEANQAEMTALERQAAAAELAMLAQSTQAKNANIRAVEKEEERAANKAFRRMQSLKRAEAGVAAAANAVALTLAMAYLGPGAPAAALGIASAQLGVQLAVINSTPKPKFHYGTQGGNQPEGIRGQEYTATLERGEAVVSRRAMQVPGAREIVAALERNQRPQTMSAPPVIIGDMQADALAARQNRPLSRTTRGLAMAGRYSRR